MSTPDFFRARLEGMVNPRHALVMLEWRSPWAAMEAVLATPFTRKPRVPGKAAAADFQGEHEVQFDGGVTAAVRPRLPIHLMASLLYLKKAFNLGDEELIQRWRPPSTRL